MGVTTTVVVDTDRMDRMTNKPRTLVTAGRSGIRRVKKRIPPCAKNVYHNFIPGGITPEVETLLTQAYRTSSADLDKNFKNDAVRDAPMRDGRYPLVIFSHGNGGTRNQNTFWCDYLASHGYIVVSPDHTGNARFTIIDGAIVRGSGAERTHSGEDRPKDMSRLLDENDQVRDKGTDKTGDKRFAGHIDTAHTAATGMSFGSWTSVMTADTDPRFIAVIAMAATPATHTNLKVPSQYWLRAEGGQDHRRDGQRAGAQRLRSAHRSRDADGRW